MSPAPELSVAGIILKKSLLLVGNSAELRYYFDNMYSL